MRPSLKAGIFRDEFISSLSSSVAMTTLIGLVFLGAFLLFSMEPLVGRLLVPYFGGAVHVWLICLTFFQAMLLVGYLYAHLFAQKLGRWHLLLLLLPFINLPLGIVAEPTPETPVLTLVGVLVARFAIPFAVLATTAVVAQLWLANSSLGREHDPYPLYAASNAGSLVALLGYPFLIEPLTGVRLQTLLWAAGYLLYGLIAVLAWVSLQPGKKALTALPAKDGGALSPASPTIAHYAQWLLLSALPSALLLTVTNFIALEVGSFPMIWVIPLALYLSSFIVTFRTDGGIPGSLLPLWPHVLLSGLVIYLLPFSLAGWGIVIFAPAVFFAICLLAHGALYERRPPVRFLTVFYLTIALGGFIGGLLVSLVAPALLSGLYEYPIIIGALALVFAWSFSPSGLFFWRPASYRTRHWARMLAMVSLLAAVLGYGVSSFTTFSACQFRHRNFYGTYSIIDLPPSEQAPAGVRKLNHGLTLHGAQFLDKNQENIPISYYYPEGPIAAVYEVMPPPRRLAIVGLGAGGQAALTRPGDRLTYYEIDPDNEKIARTWFSFLAGSKAPVQVIVGDGRLSLQKAGEAGGRFDLITIDAFTGDGIPTHLLTCEALEVYLNRLEAEGLLLFHISNRYYDLRPLMKALGEQFQLQGVMNTPSCQKAPGPYNCYAQCVVLSRSAKNLQPLKDRGWIALGAGDGLAKTVAWSDDYINILSPLLAGIKGR